MLLLLKLVDNIILSKMVQLTFQGYMAWSSEAKEYNLYTDKRHGCLSCETKDGLPFEEISKAEVDCLHRCQG